MTYDIYSSHARTGEASRTVVSTNPYSSQGRLIGFPNNLDVYTRQLSDTDGSQSVIERRRLSELAGSRLYLYHRPLIATDGTVTTITVSDGVVDTTFTNATQAYIVFSTLPSADFTVSYTAAPDCDVSWNINTLQDSVMEIEAFVGPLNNTGYAGLRNLKVATFDNPSSATVSGVLPNAVNLPHLNQNITIASSDDAGLQAIRGTNHTVQLGRTTDNVIVDATGFTITETNSSLYNRIQLGTKTGDMTTYKGQLSGAGPLTVGGPEWANYSGVQFSVALTGSYYSGSMLKVHGDASFMGNVKAVGNITIVNTTGTTSTVLGDFTVRDELFVEGQTHLMGVTETNIVNVTENLNLYKDAVARNIGGSGGMGQTLVDNLDCSEVALSYSYVTKSKHNNCVISAPINTGQVAPKRVVFRPWMSLGPDRLVGDVFSITGQLNAAASSSGEHPHILQLLMGTQIVLNSYIGGFGFNSGTWSPGMMQPGTMWVRMLDGPSQGMEGPIYGHTVEATGTLGNTVTRLNVFLPDVFSQAPQTNNKYLLYNPNSVAYNSLSAVGGASPTFSINASTVEPFAVSFEDEVRVMTSNSTNYSLTTALANSISGWATTPVTGIAYVFADSNNVDPESPPIFKARAVPMRMPGQTPIGEVVSKWDGATWTILDTISYRPNGYYDSAWIPIFSTSTGYFTSGRVTPGFNSSATNPMRVYFNHHLGTDVDIGNISADLYLGYHYTGTILFSKVNTPLYSMFGQDVRNNHGLSGALIHVPLGAKRTTSPSSDRDASIFYLDSSIIGVDISPGLVAGFPTTGATTTTAPNYLRLIVNKN